MTLYLFCFNFFTYREQTLTLFAEALSQYFSTFLGLRHPAEYKYNLWRSASNPQQFALKFSDILKLFY